MTKKKVASENGRARPPDLSRFGEGGPTKARGRIEFALSSGAPKGLKLLSREVLGSDDRAPYTYLSKLLGEMSSEGLISIQKDPKDARRSLYRWMSFELETPTAPTPALPSWFEIELKPEVIAYPDEPPGCKFHNSVRWIHWQGGRPHERGPGVPGRKYTELELTCWVSDIVHFWRGIRPPPMRQTNLGPITGAELLLLMKEPEWRGGLGHTVSQFLNQEQDIAPKFAFLPELVIWGRSGVTWRPGISDLFKVNAKGVDALLRGGRYMPDPEARNQLVAEVNARWAGATWGHKGNVQEISWERFKD